MINNRIKRRDCAASGFTLIEVLVVVAIIAILSSVVLVGLGPTRKIGRDTRRINDLRQVQGALELYFYKCGYYPGTAQPSSPCAAYTQITTWNDLVTSLTGSNIGTPQVSNDPTTGRNYLYAASNDGLSYIVGATLEDTGNPSLRDDVDGTPIVGMSFNCDDPVFCVRF